jgi:RNA polymerase sigma factor (sigma-70 family)
VTEDALLAAARRGDHRAFATLLDGYDRPLRALAYRVLGDRDDMDDAMQEAAVKAFTNLSSFDGRSSFGTWLHRVTYTTCLNVLRARGGTPESIDADDVGQTEIRAGTGQLSQARLADSDLAAEVSERLDLEQALRALSAHQRAVVCPSRPAALARDTFRSARRSWTGVRTPGCVMGCAAFRCRTTAPIICGVATKRSLQWRSLCTMVTQAHTAPPGCAYGPDGAGQWSA